MPFLFVHIVFAWIIGKCIEKVKKSNINKTSWFFLLAGSILPDLDYPIQWMFGSGIHRTLSHSLIFVLLIIIFSFLVFKILSKYNIKIFNLSFNNYLFLVIISGVGVSSHIFADMLIGWPGVPLFWPFGPNIFFFGLEYNFESVLFSFRDFASLLKLFRFALFDMFIGILWFGYLYLKGKIKF